MGKAAKKAAAPKPAPAAKKASAPEPEPAPAAKKEEAVAPEAAPASAAEPAVAASSSAAAAGQAGSGSGGYPAAAAEKPAAAAAAPAAAPKTNLVAAATSSASQVFLDIDIDGEKEAFELGSAFVDANDIKYSLTSKDVLALGGSEIARLPELFECDFEWSQRGKAIFRPPAQRVVLELFEKESPMACQNFKAFCTGEKGKSKESGKEMCYRGVPFHRIVRGFMMQGGDFVTCTGAGGESIFSKKGFKDDPGGLKLKHERGIVSMSNTGKNSNTCQFFFCFGELKQLNGKHVVFGRVVEGMEIIDRVEAEAASDGEDKPALVVTVGDCGLL